MQKQSGNFLLQALLAIAMIFLFLPSITKHITSRDFNEKMSASVQQIDTAQTAARIFIRENVDNLPYNETVLSGDKFSETLEPYGLPIGFVPSTPLNQNFYLVIYKTIADGVSGQIVIPSDNLTELQRAEMTRRIGFYAAQDENNIIVGVPLNTVFTDVVQRNASNLDNSEFLTDLDMGKFDLNNIGGIIANNGDFETFQVDTLTITGNETARNSKNVISEIVSDKTVFQNQSGETALSLTRGTLSAKTVYGKTVAKYGHTGNITSDSAAVYDFSMTSGSSGFIGPLNWDIHGDLVSDRIAFSTERLEISSFLNVASGQDVYINSDSLEYSTNSGIVTDDITTANIILREQTSGALTSGKSVGSAIIEIKPAGVSVLPDIYLSTINNNNFKILKNPTNDDIDTIDCKSIISDLDANYNSQSLAQYIICQYVYWNRLEQRINEKQCILEGKSGCN